MVSIIFSIIFSNILTNIIFYFADLRNNDLEIEDLEDDIYGSAGNISPSRTTGARVLAQQREIQLKKRQSSLQSSGMIRSSAENLRMNNISENQFTPAVRQFSAPKQFSEGGDSNEQSEFRRPSGPPSRPTAPQIARPARRMLIYLFIYHYLFIYIFRDIYNSIYNNDRHTTTS
jgi:hypothetical protein